MNSGNCSSGDKTNKTLIDGIRQIQLVDQMAVVAHDFAITYRSLINLDQRYQDGMLNAELLAKALTALSDISVVTDVDGKIRSLQSKSSEDSLDELRLGTSIDLSLRFEDETSGSIVTQLLNDNMKSIIEDRGSKVLLGNSSQKYSWIVCPLRSKGRVVSLHWSFCRAV